MNRDKFNLCDTCQVKNEDRCSMYRKDPSKTIVDCGRYRPDSDVTSFMNAAIEVMQRK